jgi:fumarylacetoacetase
MSGHDRSHDPARTSWVTSAEGHPDFPIQNLPFACVRQEGLRGGIVVAIGDEVLDLAMAMAAGWGSDLSEAVRNALAGTELNALAARPPDDWRAVRLALSDALSAPEWEDRLRPALKPAGALAFQLPFHIHDYTDFYASLHHATNVGAMFRPDNPLLPNYKWVPIGYHGRSSSIVVSGVPVRRPCGQLKAADAAAPTFGASRALDYELELGLFIGGRNPLGEPVTAARAASRIFGFCLLNDWSARDLQSWEYQPLGPFLAKNFATSISPWVVTADALIPFRRAVPPRPVGDPLPLPYLQVPDDWTLALELEVFLATAAMRERGEAPARVSRVEFPEAMYWTPSQLVTHHGSNGCNLGPGDLLGSGTISGAAPDSRGCLLERTRRGSEPWSFPDGETRQFLEDGDQVIMIGRARSPGAVSIGFGQCSGIVQGA